MRKLILFLVTSLCLALCGCSVLHDACAATAAARSSAAVLVTDAQARLDEAAVLVDALPASVRPDGMRAIVAAAKALDAARETLVATDDACAAVDVKGAFAAFVRAWEALAPFIALFAGPDGGSMVATPLVCR